MLAEAGPKWPEAGKDFHLDSNRVNTRGRLSAVSELEEWAAHGAIYLGVSEPIYRELSSGRPDGLRAQKIALQIVDYPVVSSDRSRSELKKIEECVFPGGAKDENESNDVLALFAAMKHMMTFVTEDGVGGKPRGILTARKGLADLGVLVMTDTEAVEWVRNRMTLIRSNELQSAHREGREPAPWVSASVELLGEFSQY